MLKYNFLLYLASPFILVKLIYYGFRNSVGLTYITHKLFGANYPHLTQFGFMPRQSVK